VKILTKLVSTCLCLLLLFGCNSQQTNEKRTSSSASWAYEFVIYKGDIYRITTDIVTNVGKNIGAVTKYSNIEGTYSGNFSNKYPVGTKYFDIPGVNMNKSIAIQFENSYIRADNQGNYGEK